MLISVIGLGLMGKRIAQVCVEHGHAVMLVGKDRVRANDASLWLFEVSLKSFLKKEITEEEFYSRKSRVLIGSSLSSTYGSDIVIESINESKSMKVDLMKELESVLDSHTIVASNTSSLSIDDLADSYSFKDRVVGVHFFNPAHKMKLVEFTTIDATTDKTRNIVMTFLESLGKTVINTKNRPGFIVNRILLPMINEAYYALESGVADKDNINKAMKLGCNFPMGPFELVEFIGKDVCVAILESLYEQTGDEKFIPCRLFND